LPECFLERDAAASFDPGFARGFGDAVVVGVVAVGVVEFAVVVGKLEFVVVAFVVVVAGVAVAVVLVVVMLVVVVLVVTVLVAVGEMVVVVVSVVAPEGRPGAAACAVATPSAATTRPSRKSQIARPIATL
jgi:hypothetical protein